MKISIYKGDPDYKKQGLYNWQTVEPKTFTELVHYIKSTNYAAFAELKDNHRKAKNVLKLTNIAIFDIDNDPNDLQLSIKYCKKLLNGKSYVLVTSKSHQLDKFTDSGTLLPAVERYRLIVPLTEDFNNNKDEYCRSMIKLSKDLGLFDYVDKHALKDISRQYYQSPEQAQVIINNTKKAYPVADIKEFAANEVKEMKIKKQQTKEKILNRSNIEKSEYQIENKQYPVIIDMDAMNKLDLPQIYQLTFNEGLCEEGSYLMGNGITPETSQSGQSFTVFQNNDDWLWYDFKSQESGNIISFMKAVTGQTLLESAKQLEKYFNITLTKANPSYYQNILNEALKTAKNDKSLENVIKTLTGATYVKFDHQHDLLKIADKIFKLTDLNTTKNDVVEQLKLNRTS